MVEVIDVVSVAGRKTKGRGRDGKIKALSRRARQVIVCTSFFRETMEIGARQKISSSLHGEMAGRLSEA